MSSFRIGLLVVGFCLIVGAEAAGADDSVECEKAVSIGHKATGVPADVLHAITLTETGRRRGDTLKPWPWTINREGEGHWFATRSEALAFARRSIREGRESFDVGCFQINFRWHGQNFDGLEDMFDPQKAARYAGQFLQSLYAEKRDWTRAAGAYHSRTPEFATKYQRRFSQIRAGLAGVGVKGGPDVVTPFRKKPIRSRLRQRRGPLIITIPKA